MKVNVECFMVLLDVRGDVSRCIRKTILSEIQFIFLLINLEITCTKKKKLME